MTVIPLLAPVRAEPDTGASGRSPIRVVLAEDHALVRQGLRRLLDAEEDVEVVAEVADLAAVASCVHEQRPDVLVHDLRVPGGSSIDAIAPLREREPQTQIVMMTMEASPAFATHALDAGALGFVAKELADQELLHAVRAAARGERYVSPRIAPRPRARATAGAMTRPSRQAQQSLL
jgi:two-component system response regulator NreC